jgi:hypothetical protein
MYRFLILILLFPYTCKSQNQDSLNVKEIIQTCFNNNTFKQHLLNSLYVMDCDQLIIVPNSSISEKDNIKFNRKKVIYKSKEAIFMTAKQSTFIEIIDINSSSTKEVIIKLSLSKYVELSNRPNGVDTKTGYIFYVRMMKYRKKWRFDSLYDNIPSK